MPDNIEQLVDFGVVYASGKSATTPADPKAVLGDLLDGKGWITEKNCKYPQKLILRLAQKTSVRKIQIMAHNQFVPTKVEIAVCDTIPEDKSDFDKLGTADFRDNKVTDYQARELKTILLEVDVLFVKLSVSANYPYAANKFNQVGIMAIEFFGVPYGEPVQHRLMDTRDLITRDAMRRQSMSDTKRMSTAKARGLLANDHGAQVEKLKKALKKRMKDKETSKADQAECKEAIEGLDETHENAVLLLRQERNALSEADEQFAIACQDEIDKMHKAAFAKYRVYSLLSADQIKAAGLDPKDGSSPAKVKSSKSSEKKRGRSSSRAGRDKAKDKTRSKSHK